MVNLSIILTGETPSFVLTDTTNRKVTFCRPKNLKVDSVFRFSPCGVLGGNLGRPNHTQRSSRAFETLSVKSIFCCIVWKCPKSSTVTLFSIFLGIGGLTVVLVVSTMIVCWNKCARKKNAEKRAMCTFVLRSSFVNVVWQPTVLRPVAKGIGNEVTKGNAVDLHTVVLPRKNIAYAK